MVYSDSSGPSLDQESLSLSPSKVTPSTKLMLQKYETNRYDISTTTNDLFHTQAHGVLAFKSTRTRLEVTLSLSKVRPSTTRLLQKEEANH